MAKITGFLMLLCLMLAPMHSYACTDKTIDSFQNHIKTADVIFTGRAIHTEIKNHDKAFTTFIVLRKERGFLIKKKVEVEHYTSQVGCNFPSNFVMGKDYRIIAHRKLLGRLFIKT